MNKNPHLNAFSNIILLEIKLIYIYLNKKYK
jgi:hypothetical protein